VNLSRVFLERNGQKIILQGMVHIAPEELYEKFQSHIDLAVTHDYQIFFEGVKKDPPGEAATENEAKIKKLFSLILSLYPVLSEALGISTQKEKIVYPKDAIHADITFAEFTRLLDKNGFKCNFLLWLLTQVSEKRLHEIAKENFSEKGSLNDLLDKRKKSWKKRLFGWFIFRKAKPIILGYRNKIAITKINEYQNGKNGFVHYGERHIPGLVKLLKKDGWVVKKTTYTDLAKFYEA